jgi:hypothetical protein
MTRLRRWSVIALLGSLTLALYPFGGPPRSPAAAKKEEKPAAKKWLLDRSLTVSPQREPVPALKYRLFPLSSELKEGNAVPIYLRLVHEQKDAARRYWTETPARWNALPLEKVPLREARAFLQKHRRFLRQLELGARRKRAEWNYTFDEGSLIALVLPDVKVQRSYAAMLVLKARVEIAEGDYSAAARTLQTGFAYSQHLAAGGFLLHSLFGAGAAERFADCLLDFISRADAPNLFWALTALPRPLIDMRRPLEFEYRVIELEFPELADLDRARSAKQWDAILKSLRTAVERFTALERKGKLLPAGTRPADPASKAPDLPAARKYLTERKKVSADRLKTMPAAQVLLLYLVGHAREVYDDQFKGCYLPYPQARPVLAAARKRFLSTPDTEARRFLALLLPRVDKVLAVQNRLERKIAALRVLEALRLHAAKNGELPDKLSDVTVVSVPADPGTGKPFEYQRDGKTATLTGRIPGTPLEQGGLRYRVTVAAK